MSYDYDAAVIGLGPAGMAVSIMGATMGLKVVGIEKRALGGECMNVGCIPSKALLRMAQVREEIRRKGSEAVDPELANPFKKISDYLNFIDQQKTRSMFDKVDLILREGSASFVDAHTLQVGERRVTAKRIFICTGTRPMIPPIPGLADIDYLTNESIFNLESIPSSLVILGGGAIGTELAQAFNRLGCKTTIVHMDPHLIPAGDETGARLVESSLESEGVTVLNGRKLTKAYKNDSGVVLETDQGEKIQGEKLLVAAGRKMDFTELKLENAGIEYDKKGIKVNKHLRTTASNVYAPGDCNGHVLFSHAAMHQGMIALINAMMPWPFKKDFRKYVVPWTVFSTPQYSHVGKTEKQLKADGVDYETIEIRYDDYGAAIAEGIDVGFVRVFVSTMGKIYGATIVGEGSGDMINEWGLAIQKGLRMHDIMFLQHSFPTMSFLTKRASEKWMMNRMKSSFLKRMARWMW
ncbi:MAG: FAD-dependent oxidoreductase [Planctomycetota bacterium]